MPARPPVGFPVRRRAHDKMSMHEPSAEGILHALGRSSQVHRAQRTQCSSRLLLLRLRRLSRKSRIFSTLQSKNGYRRQRLKSCTPCGRDG